MKVYQLLDKKNKWSNKFGVKNINGIPTGINDPKAESFCFGAAIIKCYPNSFEEILDRIYTHTGKVAMVYNERHSYEEIICLAKELDI